MQAGLQIDGPGNIVNADEHVNLQGSVSGANNLIQVGHVKTAQSLSIIMNGDENRIIIGAGAVLNGLRIEIGSKRWPCSNVSITIGDRFSIGSKGRFIFPNDGGKLTIGDRCMFSNTVNIRGGEYPHLVFDLETSEYIDVSDGVVIGDHVWVGEGSFIGKRATIPDECVVGARSVVTKRFDETHALIAGNPAKIAKSGILWLENKYRLEKGSKLLESFTQARSRAR